MVSSTYYPGMKSGLPAWVDSLNAKQLPKKYLLDPAGWTLLLRPTEYAAADSPTDSLYEGSYSAKDRPQFPHIFTITDPANCCGEFKTTAWGNTFLKDFAKQAISHYKLGADGVTDFLSLSFSSTDMVAHQFGPQSREVEDTYLRLDRDLEDLLNFLDQTIGKDEVLIFLTADHGGSANPNYAVDHGERGGWFESAKLHQKVRTQLGDKPGQDSLLTAVKGHTIYLNRRLAETRNLDYDWLCQAVVETITGFPGIDKAYTAKEVAAMQNPTGGELLLQNGYHPERSGDVLFLESYGYMRPVYSNKEPWRHRKGASHGSHHDYDTHVPLVWWGWNVPIAKQERPVVIPDIATTVCELLGIEGTSMATGKVMGELKD
jgi:predicted AlkP superfamily pyrophosphatase or phosphodiesterase